MAQVVQFTLEQVAEALNLPEIAVKKLAQAFQLPRGYYHQPVGYPKLFLFRPQEVAQLQAIHRRLVAGEPLQALQDEVLTQFHKEEPHALLQSSGPTVHTFDIPQSDLIDYEGDDRLKAHLAQMTFKQYRLNTHRQEAPLMAMVNALREHEAQQNTRHVTQQHAAKTTLPETRAFQFVYQSTHQKMGFEPLAPVARGVSSSLDRQIMALQDELLRRP